MKKNNYDFTVWAERIAIYFGEYIGIYNAEGRRLNETPLYPTEQSIERLENGGNVIPVYGNLEVVGYLDTEELNKTERGLADTIKHFVESNIDKEMGVF